MTISVNVVVTVFSDLANLKTGCRKSRFPSVVPLNCKSDVGSE
jgi:hypothetical protein